VSAVGRQVVDWAEQGWPADYFIEFHTEAGPRGVFGIYPDSPATGDVDTDAKRLAADLAQRISWATGLPLRGDGTMSEQQTGVGQGGSRLGVFAATAPLKADLTRLLLEVGAHTQPADQAILDAPGTTEKVAKAVADGLLGQVAPVPDTTDADLEREYRRQISLLGEKRFKAVIDRPNYKGPVLVTQRGIIGPNALVTSALRETLTDDLVTYLEANNVLTRL
jgi:hypothetical protein